jgi:formate dehydrogenase subunit gamma
MSQVSPDGQELVQRYTLTVRIIHWAVALAYVLLFLSGFALFHPYFYWLTDLFGGGTMARVLHPFIGVALATLFLIYSAGIWRDNLLLPSDREWLRQAPKIMNKTIEFPVEGKYNAGQKLLFWVMLALVVGLLLTGLPIWRPYVAPSFGAPARRVFALLHAALGFGMFAAIGVHIYAAYWTRGSISAMVRGYVTRRWARFHYPGWSRAHARPDEKPGSGKQSA